MREGQINSLRQAEELFESAKTNVHLLEISKYLVKNMNAVGVAFKNGWLNGADEHDTEYGTKYVELRDKYGDTLFPGTKITESVFDEYIGEYQPQMGTLPELLDALKCGYDFSTETGVIIYRSILGSLELGNSMLEQEIINVLDELNPYKKH
jgi:hypothetical protein